MVDARESDPELRPVGAGSRGWGTNQTVLTAKVTMSPGAGGRHVFAIRLKPDAAIEPEHGPRIRSLWQYHRHRWRGGPTECDRGS
jgi:hypothetical protein